MGVANYLLTGMAPSQYRNLKSSRDARGHGKARSPPPLDQQPLGHVPGQHAPLQSQQKSHICRFNRFPFSVAPSVPEIERQCRMRHVSAGFKVTKRIGRPGHNCIASSSCRMRRQPAPSVQGMGPVNTNCKESGGWVLIVLCWFECTEGWPKRNKTPQESRPKQPQPFEPRSVELLEHHQCHQQWNPVPQRSLGWVVGGFQKGI